MADAVPIYTKEAVTARLEDEQQIGFELVDGALAGHAPKCLAAFPPM